MDNCPVIIKLLNNEYPSTKEISAFIREYDIVSRIAGEEVIKAYAIEKYRNSLAIVMEDIGGESVNKVLQSINIGFGEKLSLAIQMTDSLIQIHKQNIIHKDVNPTNFIWNYKTNKVKIIDFGISAELVREASQSINLNILEGTLDYLSPEQTGRVNRPMDYRTDLYSLGVTFYELFTGQLPFKGDGELDLIYSHIAKIPIPPRDINSEIPVILSDIVMKLLSKTAEERYQSALGLKKDLELCRKMLEEKKELNKFTLGEGDFVDRFEIPHKLYGREAEIEKVIGGFEKAAEGHCEFLLVSGYSGIGKSSLIHEIRKPIIGKKGYFIFGKYDQYERDVPYYGIIRAFQELIRQFLAEPQASLDNWKRNITEALGGNAQVIVDILPELEQIIGPQPQVALLNPLEAQNRFQMTFLEFINVFARKEHPLVIFLDDLQWSDTSTLDLIKYILTSGNIHYVLFIGAYRENEVNAGHPLLAMMEKLKNAQQASNPSFNQIFLKPLEFAAINQLIADTFHSQPNLTEPLASIIYQKTKGNPFFVRRLLSSLYLQGTFTFLSEKGQWTYDLEKVKAVEISDNVVDLLVKSLESLPLATMDILKLVACIGSQFDLAAVSQISKRPVWVLGKDLWVAIEKEIILPLNNNYRFINTLEKDTNTNDLEMCFCFAHDRIRQAVYSLIPEREKCEIHLNIGNVFLKSFRKTKQTDAIFDIVNHLNIGMDLIEQQDERIELADLNILAGNKAKKSTAYSVALSFFETARSLLSDEEWALMPDKYFSLLLEQAMAALLTGDLLRADTICGHLSKIADNNIDKGAVTNIKVLILIFQGKLSEGLNEIRKTLRLFNISLPTSDEEIEQKMQEGIKTMLQFLARTPVEDLVNLPVMNDPEKLMAMKLLFQAVPSGRQVNPNLYFTVLLMMFELTYAHGISPLSCGCFVNCGVILGKVLGDYETGYKLGEAAFAIADKLKAESEKTPAYFIFPFLSYWRTHYQESLDYYDLAYRTGLETGDLMHLTYIIAHKVHLLMWIGKNLNECKVETENTIELLKQFKGNMPLVLTDIVYYTIQKFQAIPEHNDLLYFEKKDKEMIDRIESLHNIVYLARFYVYNTYVNIVMDNMKEAIKWNTLADKIIFAGLSDFTIPDHYLFKAMTLIYKWNGATPEEKIDIKETLTNIQQKMKYWSENCPANFEHKYYLICAGIAIIENEYVDKIIDLFQKAIDSIKDNDFIQIKAICNELFGKFWLSRGNETIGKAYIREAHYLYKQWGANRKVMLLEKQYAHFFYTNEASLQGAKVKKGTTGTITKMASSSIDMASILKSTQAISSEIKIERLLAILINTMIENAGAQRGCLLLKNEANGQFCIEATQDCNSRKLQIVSPIPFTDSEELCQEIVQYVTRTGKTVVIHDACSSHNWQNNPYIMKNAIKSVLCMPVIYQNRLKGVVYLENNLSDNVFTSERFETLKILSSQASISIENARLYENMEDKVKDRTIQLNEANEKLKELSLHDPLTNLYNRRYTFEIAYDKINQFIRSKTVLQNNNEKRQLSIGENVIGVFLIDIDYFKDVNDTYGHLAGDNVLISISKVLKNITRADDIIVRWGGEEFLIILYNTKLEYLEKFSKRILKEVKETPIVVRENITIRKTCSLGYVEMPLDITNPELLTLEQVINLSDYALYCAKEHGRNCAAHFKLIKPIGKNEELRKCLFNLSKSTKLNEEYFKIEFVKNA